MAGNQQIFQNAMNNGNSAAWDQNWELAKHYYIAALEEFPNNPGALVNLGLAVFEMGDLEQALVVYRRAAAVSPEDPAPQEKMGLIYESLGRKNEAVRSAMQAADLFLKARDVEKSIDCWERITDLHPDSLTAHTRLAMIFEKLGRKSDAVSEYLSAAGLLQRAGDPGKATQVIMYALNMVPGSSDATQALRQIKLSQPINIPKRARTGPLPKITPTESQFPESAQTGAASKLDPVAEALQHALVELAGALFDQADDDFQSGSPLKSKPGLGFLEQGISRTSAAEEARKQVLMHIGQAIEAQTHGQNDQAAEELERAQMAGFTSPALEFDIGFLQSDQDERHAIQALNAAVRGPEYAMAAYLVMGRIHYHLNEFNSAAVACLQALRLADAETVSETYRADLRQLYDPIIEGQSRSTDEEALHSLCDTVFSHLMRSDWLPLLQKARLQIPAAKPGDPPAPLAEMLLEVRSVNVIEALSTIRSLSAKGKLRTAHEEAFRAIAKSPTYLPLHVQVGDMLLQDGQQTEALKKYLLVARLYTLRGERAQAISLLQRVLKIAPMDLEIRNQLIDLLVAEGRVDDAIQQKLEAARANYQLADLETAHEIYKSAMKLAPESSHSRRWAFKILQQLTDIDMQRLDWRSALNNLTQMRTLQPEDPATRARIIDLSYRLNQGGAALAEVDQYVQLLESRNQPAAAAEFLVGQIQEHPNQLDLRLKLIEVYRHGHKVKETIEQLDYLASAYADAGLTARAATMVEEIIFLDPPNRASYEEALKILREIK
ncbi:MAG: tetratricopeptide repeat protein [Bellilinea sp.]